LKFKILSLVCIINILIFNFFLSSKKNDNAEYKLKLADIKKLYKEEKYEDVIDMLIGNIVENPKYRKRFLKILKKAGKKLRKKIEKENQREAKGILKMAIGKLKKKKEILEKVEKYRTENKLEKALIVLKRVNFYDSDIESLKRSLEEEIRREKELKVKRKQYGPIIARKYFDKAKKLYSEGYYMEALRLLNKALKIYPGLEEAKKLKSVYEGKFLFWKENFGKESAFFLQVKPFFLKGIDAYLKENWSLALQNFKKVEEAYLTPVITKYVEFINKEKENEKKRNQAKIIIKEIKMLYDNGKLDEAYKKINEISVILWDNLELGELTERVKDAMKVREYVKKGNSAKSMRDYLKAVEFYQRALSYNSKYMKNKIIDKIKSMAKMRRNVTKNKKIVFLWDELYKDPYKSDFVDKVKEVLKIEKEKKKERLVKKKEEEERRRKLEEQKRKQQKIVEMLKNAKEYYSNEEYKKAYDLCKDILKLDPKNMEAKKIFKDAEREVKKREEIRRKAIAKAVEKYYKQGLVYYTQEKYKDAILEWKKVLELDPNNERALKNIKAAQMKLGGE